MRSETLRPSTAALLLLSLLLACAAPSPPTVVPTAVPTAAPAARAAAPWLDRKRTFTLLPEASTVTMRVQEQFLGVKVPEDAVGSSQALTGRITLSPELAVVEAESGFEFDAKSIRTNVSQRDSPIRNTLGAFQFPTIAFVPKELRGLEPAARSDGAFKAQLLGEMSIKGATRPVSFSVEGHLDGASLTGTARGDLKMTDFGITPPKTMDIVWVEDLVRLEIAFSARAAE
jgi:polyisoprenoid-binding protein YceI